MLFVHVQAYDVGVARAVAELRVLAELCLPFVRPGGVWVAAKGANPEVSPQPACGHTRCGWGWHLWSLETTLFFVQ